MDLRNYNNTFTASSAKMLNQLKTRGNYNPLPLYLLYVINNILNNIGDQLTDNQKRKLTRQYIEIREKSKYLVSPSNKLEYNYNNECMNPVYIAKSDNTSNTTIDFI